MKRKLFCEISPLTYRISAFLCRAKRHIKNVLISNKISKQKSTEPLPILLYSHKSLIRRRLGNVDLNLQENKATNLAVACPKVSNIVINPGKIFSFWSLVGCCSEKKGYKEGLIISSGKPSVGIGGGMCQFTNLIHWLVLHTPLQIIEHHHHDNIDLFPDYGRQVPFGVGTSILYNYLDYRFQNNTDVPFQLIVYTTDEYLCGEIRAAKSFSDKYHIKAENEFFSEEDGIVYRNGDVYRETINKDTGILTARQLIKHNHAKVLYDTSDLDVISAAK